MAHTDLIGTGNESNSSVVNDIQHEGTPRQWAQVHYVSLAGSSIDFDDLSDGLTELALSLEELRETAATAGQEALAEGITSLVGNLAAIAPDSEALEPEPEEPDPVLMAHLFLASEFRRAQEIVNSEARRQREIAVRKEAFVMPWDLLQQIIQTVKGDCQEAEFKKAKQTVEDYGWEVTDYVSNIIRIVSKGEPFRKLRSLLEDASWYHLSSQLLEITDLILAWTRGTSANVAPGTGKAPEGVLYPYITVEMLPIPGRMEVPKEYNARKSAVVEKEAPENGEQDEAPGVQS